MKWSEIHSVVSNSLWPHGPYSPWNSPGQNTGVGSLSLLQGIFPTRDWTQVSHSAGELFISWATVGNPNRATPCSWPYLGSLILVSSRDLRKTLKHLPLSGLSSDFSLDLFGSLPWISRNSHVNNKPFHIFLVHDRRHQSWLLNQILVGESISLLQYDHNSFGDKFYVRVCSVACLVWLFAILWTVARQAPRCIGFSRREYWSVWPFLSPGDLPNQGLNPGLSHCRQTLYHPSYQGLWQELTIISQELRLMEPW